MSKTLRWLVWLAVLMVAAVPGTGSAQGNPDPQSFKFNNGQDVVPVFEGWAKNPDGSFAMWFGYFNRNYAEPLVIPVGAENKIEPGAADRGQPTYFYTRTHRMGLSVNVPADFGKKELTWTLTVHGKTEKAVAWLQPEWEIDPLFGGKYQSPEAQKNTAPNPRWFVPLMLGLMVVGLLWVVTYYISGVNQYPIPALGRWNLGVGFGLMLSGFLMTTRWR